MGDSPEQSYDSSNFLNSNESGSAPNSPRGGASNSSPPFTPSPSHSRRSVSPKKQIDSDQDETSNEDATNNNTGGALTNNNNGGKDIGPNFLYDDNKNTSTSGKFPFLPGPPLLPSLTSPPGLRLDTPTQSLSSSSCSTSSTNIYKTDGGVAFPKFVSTPYQMGPPTSMKDSTESLSRGSIAVTGSHSNESSRHVGGSDLKMEFPLVAPAHDNSVQYVSS